jgi:putative transposase
VARARRDYHHKQALALVRENQVIHVEDLNIVGMVKNRRLARAISDAGWGQFVRIIGEKADRYGPHPTHGVAVAGIEQNLLGVREPARRAAIAGAPMVVPDLLGHPRQRPQCRQGHSRRRAVERLNACGDHVRPQPVAAVDDETGSTPSAA